MKLKASFLACSFAFWSILSLQTLQGQTLEDIQETLWVISEDAYQAGEPRNFKLFKNGSFSGFEGCNYFSGEYRYTAQAGFQVEEVVVTEAECPDSTYKSLSVFFLTQVASFELKDITLTVKLKSGESLRFLSKDKEFIKKVVQKSLDTWQTLKAQKGTQYTYIIVQESVFGIGEEKEITVKKDKITAAKITQYRRENANKVIEETRQVKKKDLKAYKNMEELYQNFMQQLEIYPPQQNTFSFETDENGILKIAGYTPVMCQDDCFSGTTLLKISW